MELNNYSKIKIKDICTWERSKKGKVYPAGCWCVQVSATKGQMAYVDAPQEVESKYCVFWLNTDLYLPEYVYIMFQKNLAEFLRRTQTGLNIKPEIFNEYAINLHQDIETQRAIVKTMKLIDDRIAEEQKQVDIIKEVKRYHLGKMFAKV